jgi:hypothetical protein
MERPAVQLSLWIAVAATALAVTLSLSRLRRDPHRLGASRKTG